MKVIIPLLCVILIAVFLIPLCCDKTPWQGCDGGDPPIVKPDDEPPEESSYTFEFIEKETFIYPTLKGTIVSDIYPEKLVFYYNGEEREITGKTIAFISKSQKYIAEIEQIITYGQILTGSQSAGIFAYHNGEKITVAKITTINCPQDLFGLSVINENGERVPAMDAEDNWSDNY